MLQLENCWFKGEKRRFCNKFTFLSEIILKQESFYFFEVGELLNFVIFLVFGIHNICKCSSAVFKVRSANYKFPKITQKSFSNSNVKKSFSFRSLKNIFFKTSGE